MIKGRGGIALIHQKVSSQKPIGKEKFKQDAREIIESMPCYQKYT